MASGALIISGRIHRSASPRADIKVAMTRRRRSYFTSVTSSKSRRRRRVCMLVSRPPLRRCNSRKKHIQVSRKREIWHGIPATAYSGSVSG